MTDEQINAAIAEACGWKGNLICRDLNGDLWPNDLPNYCNDLNAMHEAEQILKRRGPEYARWLLEIVSRDAGPGIFYAAGSFAHIKAKARQRAEAFLRALGKWEETQK